VRAASASGHSEVVVGGYFQTVDTSLVAPVAPGDLVLVHAGVAIAAVELRS
jgi:hydrogenase maturation factor